MWGTSDWIGAKSMHTTYIRQVTRADMRTKRIFAFRQRARSTTNQGIHFKSKKKKTDHMSGTNRPKEKRRKDIGKDVGDVKEGTSAYVTVQTSDSFTQREVQAGVDTGPTLFMKPPRDPAQTFIQVTEPRAATAPLAASRTGGNWADASYSSSDMEAVSSSTRSNRRRQAD